MPFKVGKELYRGIDCGEVPLPWYIDWACIDVAYLEPGMCSDEGRTGLSLGWELWLCWMFTWFPPSVSCTEISLLVQSDFPVLFVVIVLPSRFTLTSKHASEPSSGISTLLRYLSPDPSGSISTGVGVLLLVDCGQSVRFTAEHQGLLVMGFSCCADMSCFIMNGSNGLILAFNVKNLGEVGMFSNLGF